MGDHAEHRWILAVIVLEVGILGSSVEIVSNRDPTLFGNYLYTGYYISYKLSSVKSQTLIITFKYVANVPMIAIQIYLKKKKYS